MRTYCVSWGGKECAICCRICTKLTLNICIFIPIYSAFVLSQFSHVQLSVTLWNYSPPGSSVHGILQASTGVGCHTLPQGNFPTQESNLCLLCFLH